MRESSAAFALVPHPDHGAAWLTRWNVPWQALNLIGGHKEADESFRDCCAREVGEELGLTPGVDFRVGDTRAVHLAYVAESRRGHTLTAYTHEVFPVRLLSPAARARADDPACAWLTWGEIRAGRAADGRAVSPTVLRLLAAAGFGPSAGGPAPVQVVVAHAAREKLCQRAARTLAKDPTCLDRIMNNLRDKLTAAFPAGRVVIVQDLYSGFRERDGESILLIEIAEAGDDFGPRVVKFGPADRLKSEHDAWTACRPAGLKHDIVLMGVEPRWAANGELIGLVYEDADQMIGVERTVTLESALLEAARLGEPTVESVGDVLFQLYERLGLLLYRHSYEDNPAAPEHTFDLGRLGRHLPQNLSLWNAPAGSAFATRATAATFTEPVALRPNYTDPVRYLEMVRESVGRGQKASELVPRLMRGRSHGDLHGRNVLVGRVGDRVLWPAVYDFEDMRADNLLGWDFVKMETEFKIRAYPTLFAGGPAEFVRDVIEFEVELFRLTERCRKTCRWRPWDGGDTYRSRLQGLLLRIRELAGRHLGLIRTNRFRRDDWLAEYYFLLTCYGLNAVRYDNLEPPQMLAAYLSAGAACARYGWDRRPAPASRAPEEDGHAHPPS